MIGNRFSRISRRSAGDAAEVIGISVLVILLVVGIPVAISVGLYHLVDRPSHYVDGRWWTVGSVAFWSLIGAIESSGRSR